MTTDVSEFMWKEFEQQHVDFPEPAMERMFESKFKRNYTVYMLAHFTSRIVTLDSKFELPDNSILHVADNFFHMDDCIDTPRLDDNIFVQNETYMKYLYHIRDFNKDGPVTYEDKYIYRQAGLPSKLLKYRSEHGSEYKYLNSLEMLPPRKTALTIINHNPLFRIRVFGRLKTYRRVQQILASILNTIVELAPTGKNQFIVLPWGEEYYDKALFLRNRDKLSFTTIKKPENLHYILMMHLVNYFWDTATTSIFSKVPDEVYDKVYFVFNTGDKYVFYNFKALKAMDSNNRIYRKIFNQTNLLSVLGRPNSDAPEAKQLVEELTADEAVNVTNKPSENVIDETRPIDKVYEPKIVVTASKNTVTDLVDSTTEDIVNKLNDVIAPKSVISTNTGIAKTTVSISIPQVSAPISDTASKETKISNITKAINTTKLKDISSSEEHISKEYITDLEKEADAFIDSNELLTPAAKNRFKKVARKYHTLELDGVPLKKILENDSDLTLKDTKLDTKIIGNIPDPSALECSLYTYDKDYINKTYKKHIAGIITSFQKSGVYLVDLKEEKVVTDLHNYTVYSCQYEDIEGKKSTVKFKLPNINEQGIVKIDGVKQYVKKQRFPLPIIKISDTVVTLTSNYNKSRVVRNTNKAHNYLDYVHSFLTDHEKSNCRIHYGKAIVNLPLAYEYTELARRYNKLEFTSRTDLARYTLYFNYPERATNFDGKPDMLSKLEAQYGTYFGKTNNLWLFVDNSNKVSVVKKTGGEADIGCYSILDVCKLAMTEPAFNKLKPLSEWVTITILDLNIPVIFMLAYRYGLRNILDYMGVKYTITENRSKTIVGENTIEGTEAFDVKPSLARVQYLNELNKSGIDKNKIIIGASAALVAYGLLDTPNKDLDISIEDNYKKTLINKGVLIRNIEDGATHWVVSNTHIDAGVDGPDQQKFSYTELKKLGVAIINGYTFISLEGMIKFYEKCKELFPDDEEKQQKYNDRIALIEQALATGTEAFVQDKISGDIPSYDDSIEDYSKDTVVCYEGIWKDNFAKRDAHNYDGYKEINAELMDMIARINKKYDKDLSNNEAIKYIKEKLYSYGSRIVVTSADLDAWRKKYNLSDEDLINGYCTTQVFGDHYYASSYGKSIIPLIEQVIEDEAIPLKTVNFARNELYGHEIYHLEHITDHILRFRQHGIHITKEFIDFMLLARTAHEDGHSTAPKSINDECLRTHTFDAHEKYANDCMIIKLREYVKDILNDKEEEEIVHVTSGIRKAASSIIDNIPHIFGLESLGRPVKPRLDKVKLYLTLRSDNVQFNNCQVQVRAMIITVALGTKASCTRRITNYDSAVFTTPSKDSVPRDLVDKASAYLNCGLRKISKAEIVWIPADKVPDRQVLETPRLTPVEYKKMTSKLNINENKVRPPQEGSEDWSIGFEDISDDVKYVPKPNDIHIKFADRVLHINRYPLAHSLIIAGLEYFDVSRYDMSEFESKDVYYRLLMDKKLSINYIKGMDSFYDLFVDNMTYSVLKMMHEPTTVRDLLIRSTVLLTTTDHLPASSGYNHRIRGYEQFAGVVYNELAREFAAYQSKNGANNKFSVNPDAVYLRIIQNASMLPAESGSPIEDMTLMCDMTYGGVGGRSADSFVITDRHYDVSDVGVVSESTVDNQKVAFNSALSYNPNIVNTLGMPAEIKQEDLKASQVFSPHVLMFPFSTSDDSKRMNFVKIQCAHLVPTEGYDKVRVRTGYERVLAHRCGKNFAGVAKDNGKITAIDEKARLVEVTYNNGTKEVYPYGSELLEFDSMELESKIVCNVKLGQKVNKGDIITYNSEYFKKDTFSGQIDMSIGTLANVIFMEMDTTLEDSTEISQRLSKKLTMNPVNVKVVSLSGKSLIHKYLDIGTTVSPTDDLMIFEEDSTATENMNTNDEALEMLAELNRRTPSAGYAGKIIRIDAYYSCDPSEMHPTVYELVKKCTDEKNRRHKLAKSSNEADEYPQSSVIKEGSKYKGITFDKETVVFIFHIQERIPHSVGDKLVLCNQLKCTCGGIFPRPIYSESGIEVDMFFSMMSTNKRIVLSPFKFGITSRILMKIEDDICLEYFGEHKDKD